jgi:hypothetical protein
MPQRQKYMSAAQQEIYEKTPPRYRDSAYTGSIYKPDFSAAGIRAMTIRIRGEVRHRKLSDVGHAALEAWIMRLQWFESMYLATASYQFRPVMMSHLDYVTTEFALGNHDRVIIENALFEEFRQMFDYEQPSVLHDNRPRTGRNIRLAPRVDFTHVAS